MHLLDLQLLFNAGLLCVSGLQLRQKLPSSSSIQPVSLELNSKWCWTLGPWGLGLVGRIFVGGDTSCVFFIFNCLLVQFNFLFLFILLQKKKTSCCNLWFLRWKACKTCKIQVSQRTKCPLCLFFERNLRNVHVFLNKKNEIKRWCWIVFVLREESPGCEEMLGGFHTKI